MHVILMLFMLRKNPHNDYLTGRLKLQLADISKLAILTKKSISGVDNHSIKKDIKRNSNSEIAIDCYRYYYQLIKFHDKIL